MFRRSSSACDRTSHDETEGMVGEPERVWARWAARRAPGADVGDALRYRWWRRLICRHRAYAVSFYRAPRRDAVALTCVGCGTVKMFFLTERWKGLSHAATHVSNEPDWDGARAEDARAAAAHIRD